MMSKSWVILISSFAKSLRSMNYADFATDENKHFLNNLPRKTVVTIFAGLLFIFLAEVLIARNLLQVIVDERAKAISRSMDYEPFVFIFILTTLLGVVAYLIHFYVIRSCCDKDRVGGLCWSIARTHWSEGDVERFLGGCREDMEDRMDALGSRARFWQVQKEIWRYRWLMVSAIWVMFVLDVAAKSRSLIK
jgi:hypothetical protein